MSVPHPHEVQSVEAPSTSNPKGLTTESSQTKLDVVVVFLIGRGGGGHKASAIAVRDCLVRSNVPWASDIEFIDAGEVVEEAIHGCCARCCCSGDDIYNKLMKWGFYRVAGVSGHIASRAVKNNSKRIIRRFAELWLEYSPALVVSFVPFLNALVRRSLFERQCKAQLVTIITDMANSPAHRWIDEWDESARIQTIVAGNATLEEQAKELGYKQQVLRTSGMVVHPAFYDEEHGHAAPSLAPNPRNKSAQSALIFFGGFAPMRVERIAKKALESSPDMRLVVVCGGNKRLRRRLNKIASKLSFTDRCVVEGFISAERLRQHMKSVAVVMGKPGPGVTTEAYVCQVPFIAERRSVMPQEVCVLQWLEQCGIAVIVDNLEKLPNDLFLSLGLCREAFGKVQANIAVFEVSGYLKKLVEDQT